MYSKITENVYTGVRYTDTADKVHDVFINGPFKNKISLCENFTQEEIERAILEMHSRVCDDGHRNVVDKFLGLYGKVFIHPQIPKTTEKVFDIIQEEIDNLQIMIDNINEAQKEGKKSDGKVQLKSDLLYKQEAYKQLYNKLQGRI